MNRIAVYRLVGTVWYDSFADVVRDLTVDGRIRKNTHTGETLYELPSYIGDIVEYNVCFRNILRSYGIDSLIQHLVEEAPDFGLMSDSVKSLKESVERIGDIGDYDIQCLSVRDSFEVLGQRFSGLDDVWSSAEDYISNRNFYSIQEDHVQHNGIHVLCNYELYPRFDVSDNCDNRAYKNYFFSTKPFSRGDMKRVMSIRGGINYCKAHEHLKYVEKYPLLYHDGDSESMLLVTPAKIKL